MTEKEILELLLAKVNEQGEILKSHGEILKEHGDILKEHGEILQAIKHGQEIQKAEIDRLNLTVAQIQGDQAEIKEIVHNMAGDISFLIRKVAKHDDDLRELRWAK